MFPTGPHPSQKPEDLESLLSTSPDQWIEILKSSDRSYHSMLAIEVWSIAKTMENLLPGFWYRFMYNRQIALKEYIAKKQEATGATPPQS